MVRRRSHDEEKFNHTCCEYPDGCRLEDGVSGTELREGDSSGLRSVCTLRLMLGLLLETVDESRDVSDDQDANVGSACELQQAVDLRLLWETDQLPESRASRASD